MNAEPSCPRCGYDLSGATVAWAGRGACDVDGTCSECGLRFAWAELFNPRHRVPHWSYEHAIGHRPWAALRSVLAACVPWFFWRSMRMQHPVRVERLVWLVIVLGMTLHLSITPLSMIWAGHQWDQIGWIGTWAPKPGATPIPEKGWVLAMTALFPYANWLQLPDWASGYVVHQPSPLVGIATWSCLLLPLLLALAFGLLPDTLRRAKVRRQHIARALCWSFCGVVVLLVAVHAASALLLLDPPGWLTGGRALDLVEFASPLGSVLATAVFLATWWWFAIRLYLRLEHAAAVWLAMLAVGGLATGVLATGIVLIEHRLRA